MMSETIQICCPPDLRALGPIHRLPVKRRRSQDRKRVPSSRSEGRGWPEGLEERHSHIPVSVGILAPPCAGPVDHGPPSPMPVKPGPSWSGCGGPRNRQCRIQHRHTPITGVHHQRAVTAARADGEDDGVLARSSTCRTRSSQRYSNAWLHVFLRGGAWHSQRASTR